MHQPAQSSIEQNDIYDIESFEGLGSVEPGGGVSSGTSFGTAATLENADSEGDQNQEGDVSGREASDGAICEDDAQLFATEGKDYIAVVGKRYFTEAYEAINQVNQQHCAAGLHAG